MKEMHRNSEIIVDNGKVAVLSCFLFISIKSKCIRFVVYTLKAKSHGKTVCET